MGILEVRTYDLKPRSVPDFENGFAESLPGRMEFSPLGGLWHTEAGPLNQVVHIWPYDDINARTDIRAKSVASGKWPPKTSQYVVNMQSDIYIAAPFMPAMDSRKVGPIFEMRIYTYNPGDIPQLIEAWGGAIEERVKSSPLVAAMYSDIGPLNKWMHIWAYESFDQRMKVRAETREKGVWPPKSPVSPIKQESKILIPAACSPMQ